MRRVLCGVVAALALAPASAMADGYSVRALNFSVTVGPNKDQHCNIVGDLYTPNGASASHPAPAILTTNGFGGSKADQADWGKEYANKGYVVLSYSGLGFGGSGCKITLDDPDYDGQAGSQLVSFLGGASGIATDASTGAPVAIDYVTRDDSTSGLQHDPRVGMIGGSYGGEIQFSVAGVDPRVDTIIPMITWNDLSYSLAPNNTNFDHGVSATVPGTEKYEWTSLFFALGIADGVTGAQSDPTRLVGLCPNFDERSCPAKAYMDLMGYPNENTVAFARHASVESYLDNIKIPVFLSQGQSDTLFNTEESAATYNALKGRGVPVKMMWQEWGHSGGAASGENGTDPVAQYDPSQYEQWLDWYLKDVGTKPALDFSYFRDWVSYSGSARPAYGHSATYPVSGSTRFYLSGNATGSGWLVSSPLAVAGGTQAFVAPAQAPTSYSETSAVEPGAVAPTDAPGTFASWTSGPLAHDLFVAGVPGVDVTLNAPANHDGVSPSQDLLLFVKVYDVTPSGPVLVHKLVAPARFPDAVRPVHVDLPGIVHKFAAGDKIELVVAGSDAAFRGDTAAWPVTIQNGPGVTGQLTLPTIAG